MNGQAGNPGKVKFSHKKYYSFRNKINTKFSEKYFSDMQIELVSQILMFGDTQPATVVSTAPLLIAAYSDEMDGVVMLRFDESFAEQYDLHPGDRLTASCVYFGGTKVAQDIFNGAGWTHNFANFAPIIQLFLGKKDDKIREKTALFPEETWEKVAALAAAYREKHPDLVRDGLAFFKKENNPLYGGQQ